MFYEHFHAVFYIIIFYGIIQNVQQAKRGNIMPIWRNRPLMVTIIVVIVLFVLLIITAGENNMTGSESLVGRLLSPVQNALYSATESVGNFFSRMFSGSDLEANNQELEARVAELEAQLQNYEEIRQENERLSELLNFNIETQDLTYLGAKVIGKAPGHWFNILIINVGLKDGIKVDMPVITNDGLVGCVVDCGPNWSRVMAIVDSSAGVDAIVERTRDNGIVKGTVTSGEENKLLSLSNLPLDADLVPGDTVITSGLSGIYPKGIAIGEVSEVSPSSDGMSNEAVVTPWVDFEHIEEVLVITTEQVDIEEALGE
jgi:rod shape-determining protein MreC